MSTEIEHVKWNPTVQPSTLPKTLNDFVDNYRPKIIKTYIDEQLNKEVKVFEPRYC